MIRTQEEYTNACDFIDSDMELYDFQLSEKMSSYEYNLYLQDTEYFLNFLYEKIRTLEDLCNYLDRYVDTKIKNARQEIADKTALLNHSLSNYLVNNVTVFAPEWNNVETIIDRDGSIIKNAMIDKDMVKGMARYSNFIEPVSIEKLTENHAYVDTIHDFCKTKRYLTKHKDNIVKEKNEMLKIKIPADKSYNHVSFNPINADIDMRFDENQNIILSVSPLSYDKREQPLSYSDYVPSALDTLSTKTFRYDTTNTYINNMNIQNDIINQSYYNQYENSIIEQQKRAYVKNNKSKIIGA